MLNSNKTIYAIALSLAFFTIVSHAISANGPYASGLINPSDFDHAEVLITAKLLNEGASRKTPVSSPISEPVTATLKSLDFEVLDGHLSAGQTVKIVLPIFQRATGEKLVVGQEYLIACSRAVDGKHLFFQAGSFQNQATAKPLSWNAEAGDELLGLYLTPVSVKSVSLGTSTSSSLYTTLWNNGEYGDNLSSASFSDLVSRWRVAGIRQNSVRLSLDQEKIEGMFAGDWLVERLPFTLPKLAKWPLQARVTVASRLIGWQTKDHVQLARTLLHWLDEDLSRQANKVVTEPISNALLESSKVLPPSEVIPYIAKHKSPAIRVALICGLGFSKPSTKEQLQLLNLVTDTDYDAEFTLANYMATWNQKSSNKLPQGATRNQVKQALSRWKTDVAARSNNAD